jgi:signal recognition particle receptor subunit beta
MLRWVVSKLASVFAVCILANKQDLPDALSAARVEELLSVSDIKEAGIRTVVFPGMSNYLYNCHRYSFGVLQVGRDF